MHNKAKSIISVLICVFLWALIPVVAKLGQTGLDNHQFLFWSSLVSFLVFVLLNLIQCELKNIVKLDFNKWIKPIILGALGTYLYYILLYFGYAHAKGLEVLVIQYCWPIFVVLLSIIILKEKITARKIISITLGFTGVFLVLTKCDFRNLHFGNLYVDSIVLLAAFVFGLFSVLSKNIKINLTILLGIYFLVATIASFTSMNLLSEFKLPTLVTLIPILINGIFVNGISYIFWIRSMKQGGASFVAPFVFLTPVISTVYLITFFNDNFQNIYIVGMALVVSAGLINIKE